MGNLCNCVKKDQAPGKGESDVKTSKEEATNTDVKERKDDSRSTQKPGENGGVATEREEVEVEIAITSASANETLVAAAASDSGSAKRDVEAEPVEEKEAATVSKKDEAAADVTSSTDEQRITPGSPSGVTTGTAATSTEVADESEPVRPDYAANSEAITKFGVSDKVVEVVPSQEIKAVDIVHIKEEIENSKPLQELIVDDLMDVLKVGEGASAEKNVATMSEAVNETEQMNVPEPKSEVALDSKLKVEKKDEVAVGVADPIGELEQDSATSQSEGGTFETPTDNLPKRVAESEVISVPRVEPEEPNVMAESEVKPGIPPVSPEEPEPVTVSEPKAEPLEPDSLLMLDVKPVSVPEPEIEPVSVPKPEAEPVSVLEPEVEPVSVPEPDESVSVSAEPVSVPEPEDEPVSVSAEPVSVPEPPVCVPEPEVEPASVPEPETQPESSIPEVEPESVPDLEVATESISEPQGFATGEVESSVDPDMGVSEISSELEAPEHAPEDSNLSESSKGVITDTPAAPETIGENDLRPPVSSEGGEDETIQTVQLEDMHMLKEEATSLVAAAIKAAEEGSAS